MTLYVILGAGLIAGGAIWLAVFFFLYRKKTVKTTIDELLDGVFFILVPEENVEGGKYSRSVSAYRSRNILPCNRGCALCGTFMI